MEGHAHLENRPRDIARRISHPQGDRVDAPVLFLVAFRAQSHQFATPRNHDVMARAAIGVTAWASSGSSLVTFSMTTLLMRLPSSASLALLHHLGRDQDPVKVEGRPE